MKIRNRDHSYLIDREKVGGIFQAVEPSGGYSEWMITHIDDDGIWGVPKT